jgi:hypothetical protein
VTQTAGLDGPAPTGGGGFSSSFNEPFYEGGPASPEPASATAEAHGPSVTTTDGVITFTVDECRMLEVVVDAVRLVIEEQPTTASPEDIAQIQAAVDTIQAQLRAPRPSRGAVGWALDQIRTFPGGVLSGAAATYLPTLLHTIHP